MLAAIIILALGRVGQAFQPAGSWGFLAPRGCSGDWKVAGTGRLESMPYRIARIVAVLLEMGAAGSLRIRQPHFFKAPLQRNPVRAQWPEIVLTVARSRRMRFQPGAGFQEGVTSRDFRIAVGQQVQSRQIRRAAQAV